MNRLASYGPIVLAYALGLSIATFLWSDGLPLVFAAWFGLACGSVLSLYSWVRCFDSFEARVRLDEEVTRAIRQAHGDYRR